MIQLKANNQIFSGWTRLQVTRGIEQITGTFDISLTERWSEFEHRDIAEQDACHLLLDEQLVITGFIDDYQPEFDANNHLISVAGRDKTGDLVDCSAIHKTGQWKNARLETIATDLCVPFGIKVITQTDTGAAFPSFNIEDGETVFECLDRAARLRAVLLMADGLGNLLLTRAGTTRATTDLVEGQNIKSARGQFSARERFSQYLVKGQMTGTGTGSSAAQIRAKSNDASVKRYRPLIVLAEDQDKNLSLRAQWERNVRMGRGTRASITVQGWTMADGKLWVPNMLVRLKSPALKVDRDLLIASVTYNMDENGKTAELSLCRPEAFELIPETPKKTLKSRSKKRDSAFDTEVQP